MKALPSNDAYRLWAPGYAAETAVSALDQELASVLSPPLEGRRLLDAGCGVGRRLVGCGAALAAGVDASVPMLAQSIASGVAAADILALPFADREFDLVWCRLVLGHLADAPRAYRELARVCRAGGYLLVTDFHADAVAAGHSRSFADTSGIVHSIEHHVYEATSHIAMAADAGFVLAARRDAAVGPSTEPFYRKAGRLAAYERDIGLALVAGFLFRRA